MGEEETKKVESAATLAVAPFERLPSSFKHGGGNSDEASSLSSSSRRCCSTGMSQFWATTDLKDPMVE